MNVQGEICKLYITVSHLYSSYALSSLFTKKSLLIAINLASELKIYVFVYMNIGCVTTDYCMIFDNLRAAF